MSEVWPKSVRDVCDKWHNESEILPPIGTRCRLVLTSHEDVPEDHLQRDGKEVEIIAHIVNGNLAVCVCYEDWAKNDVGEWWVAAFNDKQFQPISEPFWPRVSEQWPEERCPDCGCGQYGWHEKTCPVLQLNSSDASGNVECSLTEDEAMSELALGFEWPEYADCLGQVLRKDFAEQGLEPERFTGLNHLCREDWRERREEIWGAQENKQKRRSKYHREIAPDIWVDVYDVLKAFEVTNPADAHAIKKMMMPGKRGSKDANQDRAEAIESLHRAMELEQ